MTLHINKEQLSEVREETHKAVQLVAMVPRCLLDPDPTDGTASLLWDKHLRQLVSQDVHGLVAGFEFAHQEIHLIRNGQVIQKIATVGCTYEEVFKALKVALTEQGQNGEALRTDLPYVLPDAVVQRGGPFREQNAQDLDTLTMLYELSSEVLEGVFGDVKEASGVRCWPHHYDLATLVTLIAHENPEKAKTIGFGFSPGDEGYDEPYFYLTPWPYPEPGLLFDLTPPAFWNREGWTGGVLKAADLSEGHEKETIIDYFKEGFDKLKLIV